MFLLILPILAHALMTAHLLFNGFGIWSFAPLLALIPLFIRRPAMIWIESVLLILWGIEWLRADYALVMRRMAYGRPHSRRGRLLFLPLGLRLQGTAPSALLQKITLIFNK